MDHWETETSEGEIEGKSLPPALAALVRKDREKSSSESISTSTSTSIGTRTEGSFNDDGGDYRDWPLPQASRIRAGVSSDGMPARRSHPTFRTLALTVNAVQGLYTRSRTLRLFVSSSFLDFQEERRLLHEKVFPKLRKECEARGLILNEIDLRWGVSEHAESAHVISVCLDEVEKCAPYILCFLGDRYGWIPSDDEINACEGKYGWVKKKSDCSITHLEIIAGILNIPVSARSALVYDRTSDACLPEDVRREAQQLDCLPKMKALKQSLEKEEGVVYRKYARPDEIMDKVLEDLLQVLEKNFPAHAFASMFDEETYTHRAFARSRLSSFIEAEKYTQLAEKVVTLSKRRPVMVLSRSGAGKSSFLSYLVLRQLERRSSHVFYHAHYSNILRRLLHQLKEWCPAELRDDVPTDPRKMISLLPDWLSTAGSVLHGKTVFVAIDALNQLEDVDKAKELRWLPSVWPRNIQVIVTSTDQLTWEGEVMAYPALDRETRVQIVSSHLAKYAKVLDATNMQLLREADHVVTPMHLVLLLSELRVFGNFKDLEGQIKGLLEARDVYELASHMFGRWENTFEATFPAAKTWKFQPEVAALASEHSVVTAGPWSIVVATLLLLRCSYRGLREQELLELLGVSRSTIVHFLYMLEEIVQSQSGLLIFSHSSFVQTVESAYLTRIGEQLPHAALAAYFEGYEDTHLRKLEEYPHHLLALDAREKLCEYLTRFDVFMHYFGSDFLRIELSSLWRSMGTSQAGDRYRAMLEKRILHFSRQSKKQPSTTQFTASSSDSDGRDDAKAQNAVPKASSDSTSFARAARVKPFVQQVPTLLQVTAAKEISYVAHCLHEWGEYTDAEAMFLWALYICHSGLATQVMSRVYTRTRLIEKLGELISSRLRDVKQETRDRLHAHSKSRSLTARPLGEDGLDKEDELDMILETDEAALQMHQTARILESFARMCTHKGDASESKRIFELALTIHTKLHGESDFRSSDIMGDLAWLAIVGNRFKGKQGAIVLLKKAMHAKTELFRTKCGLGNLPLDSQVVFGAKWEAFFKKLLEVSQMGSAPELVDPYLPGLVNRFGVALDNMRQYNNAVMVYQASLALREALSGHTHPAIATICGDIGAFYNRLVFQRFKSQGRRDIPIEDYQDPFDIAPELASIATKSIASEGEESWRDGNGDGDGDGAKEEKVKEEGTEEGTKPSAESTATNLSRETSSNATAAMTSRKSTFLPVEEHVTATEYTLESLAWLDRAIAVRRETLGVWHPFLATVYMSKGDTLVKTAAWKSAGPYYKLAYHIRCQVFGQKSKSAKTAERRLNNFLVRERERDQAAAKQPQ